ncbi:MAG: hypothetical protein IKQ91_04995 [Oscillospiraceae bacterium]|nr:hypothetical protein [Oscillospiraceae bacterium]
METGFPTLMIFFGIALVLYAGLIRWQGVDVIPRMYAVKVPHPKAFAKNMAHIVALIGLSPLISGLIGLKFGPGVCAIAIVVTLILMIVLCVWLFKPREGDPRE